MKRNTLLVTTLLFCLFSYSAEADILVNAGTEVLNIPGTAASPNPEFRFWAGSGFDIYKPLSDSLSLFFTGDGKIESIPGRELLSGNVLFTGDVSWRTDTSLLRLRLQPFLLSPDLFSVPDIGSGAQIYFSSGNFTTSFFAEAGASAETLPQISGELMRVSGRTGLSHTLFLQYLLNIEVAGGLTAITSTDPDWFVQPELSLTWYPGLPFTAQAEAGFVYRNSARTGLLLSTPLPIYSSKEVFWDVSGSFSPGSSIQLEAGFPGRMTFKDHAGVDTDRKGLLQFLDTREWVLLLEPEISFTFEIPAGAFLILETGLSWSASNSYYQRFLSANISAEVELLF